MSVPGTQEIHKPLLETFKGDAPRNFVINELIEIIAEKLNVQLEELSLTEKTAFKNNINDAIDYLRKKKLISQPSKTTYMITRAGSEFLQDDSLIPETETQPETEEHEEHEQSQAQNLEDSDIPVDFSEQETEHEEPEETQSEIDFENQNENSEPEENIENLEATSNDEEVSDMNDAVQELNEENEEIEIETEKSEIPDEIELAQDPAPESDVIEGEIEEIEEVEKNESETDMPEPEPESETETEIETPEPEAESLDMKDVKDMKDMKNSNIEDVIAEYNEKLADELIEKISEIHQESFCMLVMDLLSKMGYRVFQSARYTNEAEGSDLIHGIILEDKAGMTPIYIQARKLSSAKSVGKADMQDFIEAIADKGGKGMFVTSGKFSEAAEVAANDERIMLLDGKKLAGLMIANNFCVNTEKIFELKALDSESFSEYEN